MGSLSFTHQEVKPTYTLLAISQQIRNTDRWNGMIPDDLHICRHSINPYHLRSLFTCAEMQHFYVGLRDPLESCIGYECYLSSVVGPVDYRYVGNLIRIFHRQASSAYGWQASNR